MDVHAGARRVPAGGDDPRASPASATAIIFISAIHLTDVDRLRAYEMGAVDYVPVPVIPEVLRAKVKIFAELYRKTRQLEQLNRELERRVAERTAELEASTARLMQSEQRRSLALAAGQMGSWEWDPVNGDFAWDDGQYRSSASIRRPSRSPSTISGADPSRGLEASAERDHAGGAEQPGFQTEFRVCRPGSCAGASAPRWRASTPPITSCASAA